ncbi:AraC family transcriptional regulator [soil metagenome]
MRAIGVSMAGLGALRDPYRVGRVQPRYHVVLVTLGGEGLIRGGAQSTALREGTVAFLPAGSTYEYRSTVRWAVGWFHLRNEKRWRPIAAEGIRVQATREHDRFRFLMELLLGDVEGGRGRELRLSSELLAMQLLRVLESAGSPPSPLTVRLRAVLRLVEERPAESWTVSGLARLAAVSEPHLHRLALEHWGAPPMRAVSQIRMHRAAALLLHTDLSVAQIADAIGYSDQFAFSAAFKRSKGLSPMIWREAD